MKHACITRIATAVPSNDMHAAFVEYATRMLDQPKTRQLLRLMAQRSGIEHRFSFISADEELNENANGGDKLFERGNFPVTSQRMKLFEQYAPVLLRCALGRLALNAEERHSIRHIIVTCCTGLYAPGLDFAAMEHLGLDPGTERTMVGFMGCYAAINGLKLARHIVRSEPDASVLMINLELCSLHFQETQSIEKVLSFLLFGDGCAVSLVRSSDKGLALDSFSAFTIPTTQDLIRWNIGDSGFDMELSGKVPVELGKFLRLRKDEFNPQAAAENLEAAPELWAVHPGGRSILDAVESALQLPPEKLAVSRSILRQFGNMSSATVMFVLESMMKSAMPGQSGCAMAFGPGLTAETMKFHVC
jgi:alpha-pyrone synthase